LKESCMTGCFAVASWSCIGSLRRAQGKRNSPTIAGIIIIGDTEHRGYPDSLESINHPPIRKAAGETQQDGNNSVCWILTSIFRIKSTLTIAS
jgi:hypothetical protein